jgi:hypothetical protein
MCQNTRKRPHGLLTDNYSNGVARPVLIKMKGVLFAMVDTGLGNALAPFEDGNRNVERAERCNSRFCQSHAVVNLQFQVSSSPNANAESPLTKKLTRYFDHPRIGESDGDSSAQTGARHQAQATIPHSSTAHDPSPSSPTHAGSPTPTYSRSKGSLKTHERRWIGKKSRESTHQGRCTFCAEPPDVP